VFENSEVSRTVVAAVAGSALVHVDIERPVEAVFDAPMGWLAGETIAMDGAQGLATGGNFYELRKWGDSEWRAARAAIESQNARDRAHRG
jgi:hypothetical protein